MSTTPSGEDRNFSMHPNLLFNVIMRQAGTLQKALLEGVMNAIDAGATRCAITLTGDSFVVEDDGKGFQNRQEIKDFFDTFGTPHEAGDAIYGQFRMGRGQMMAFGRNVWRSRTFQMDVDVKTRGLGYVLTEHEEDFKGTRISAELYDKITPSDLERVKGELRKFVAWAQIPVTLNGEVISKHPADGKWTYEDEDAYYNLSSERQQMAVYNVGVLVNSFYAGRFGIGGSIVTKRQIEVNFARNDVQSTCPIFKRIQAHMKKESGTVTQKKVKLTDAERDNLTRDFLAGALSLEDALKLRAITDVNGRSWPLRKLLQLRTHFSGHILVAERGDMLAEQAQNQGMALCVDESTLERFGAADGNALIARIAQVATSMTTGANAAGRAFRMEHYDMKRLAEVLQDVAVIEREILRDTLSEDHIGFKETELTADQKVLLHAIASSISTMVDTMNAAEYEDTVFHHRKIRLGKSDTALAWTDGTKNIWFDLRHAALLRNGYAGAYQIAMTMLHEMLHTGPDTGTHQHDHAFYQAFHDLAGDPLDPVGRTAERMVTMFTTGLRNNKKKITSKLLKSEDVTVVLSETLRTLEEREASNA